MNRYVVHWLIDMETSSPEVACERAREIQMDPNNIATVFEVYDDEGNFVKRVDLAEAA